MLYLAFSLSNYYTTQPNTKSTNKHMFKKGTSLDLGYSHSFFLNI